MVPEPEFESYYGTPDPQDPDVEDARRPALPLPRRDWPAPRRVLAEGAAADRTAGPRAGRPARGCGGAARGTGSRSDPRPRPPGAVPEHAAGVQADLAAVGRVVHPGAVLDRWPRPPRLPSSPARAARSAGWPGSAPPPSAARLATYTAALLANTAVPAWHEAHRELPFVFAAAPARRRGRPRAARRTGAGEPPRGTPGRSGNRGRARGRRADGAAARRGRDEVPDRHGGRLHDSRPCPLGGRRGLCARGPTPSRRSGRIRSRAARWLAGPDGSACSLPARRRRRTRATRSRRSARGSTPTRRRPGNRTAMRACRSPRPRAEPFDPTPTPTPTPAHGRRPWAARNCRASSPVARSPTLACGPLTDTHLVGLARRRPPREANREQAVRHAEIRRVALALREAARDSVSSITTSCGTRLDELSRCLRPLLEDPAVLGHP